MPCRAIGRSARWRADSAVAMALFGSCMRSVLSLSIPRATASLVSPSYMYRVDLFVAETYMKTIRPN